ncbi:MAG: hypothetical protein KKH92_02855 [Firmicutes bacterium]|nr:hypothetical protein [Bacillota bacterium]
MKEIKLDSLTFYSKYKDNIDYLNKNGIKLINNSFEYTFFGKFKANVTLHRLYPLFRNKCYISLSFNPVTNKTFDDVNSILETEFGEANYYQNSYMQYWRSEKYHFYHTLEEDRLGSLHHYITIFLKPFAVLLPKTNYIQIYQGMKEIEKRKGIALKLVNASTIIFVEGYYEYHIHFNKKKVTVYLRKNTQIDQDRVSNSPVNSYTKIASIDKMDEWFKAVNELLDTARNNIIMEDSKFN